MLSADGEPAKQLAERMLEQTGNALLSNDFDAFAQLFCVPHTLETPDRKTTLQTRSALKEVFDRVVQDYAEHNVTALVRINEHACFHGPFKIEAMHVTHMMSGNWRIKDPIPSYGILEFIDNRWQCTSSQYAVDDNTTVGLALRRTASAAAEIEKPTHGIAVSVDEKRKN